MFTCMSDEIDYFVQLGANPFSDPNKRHILFARLQRVLKLEKRGFMNFVKKMKGECCKLKAEGRLI